MPHQNRVTPFSRIEATPHRGLFIGNRGCLHNAKRELVTQRWRTQAWIICDLHFRGWKREVMQPGRWTELFFLDEAVALAAGHRPCAYCRRADFNRYMKAAGYRLAKELDPILHAQRTGLKPTMRLEDLPDGAFVEIDNEAWLVWNGHLRLWSHAGYLRRVKIDGEQEVTVLTPELSIRALRSGFTPVIHPSAG